MNHHRNAEVDALISKLSLDEKVAQLAGMLVTDLIGPPREGRNEMFSLTYERLDQIRPHGVGHISMGWFLGTDRENLRESLTELQHGIQERSPFGIGALVHFEAINGLVHGAAPQFPTAWAQAAAWSPDLVRRAARVSSDLMMDAGIHVAFSPVMDVARDSRWGRVHETYGEDPELVSQNSVAFVRGIQGDQNERPVAATGKHFVGYGVSEGGLNQAVTQLGTRALIDEYAEPFRRAIAEAGLAMVMNSYNEIDGVPSSSNRWLFQNLLRETLGFEGSVMSDYDSITMLHSIYHTARTPGEAGVQALTAGIDADLPGGANYLALADEVRAGRLEERVVDAAVARVLDAKIRAGLVPGFTARAAASSTVDLDAEAREVRVAMADRGLVLLSNDGILPLETTRNPKVVVVGPAADELRIHFGAYTSASNIEMQLGSRALSRGEIPGIDPTTFVFTDIFQARMPGIDPTFEAATADLHPDAMTVVAALRESGLDVVHVPLGSFDDTTPIDPSLLREAVEGADVVIAAVGERTGWVGNNTAGEGQSTAEPRLPGNQNQLVAALAETGTPIVTIVVSGRPLLLSEVVDVSAAVLLAPLLGEEAAPAIARTVIGHTNPSGHLPSTFPRSAGQQPMYHGHHYGSGYDHPTGTRHSYNDLDSPSPLFAFGHGLSYTSFTATITHAPESVGADGEITVQIEVANTGERDGETVVQLYARDEVASIVRPVRQLLQFQRVEVPARQEVSVTLNAPVSRLAFTGLNGERRVETGEVTLLVGLAADDIHTACSTVIVSLEA